jgi:hypothetical protein
LHQNLKDTEVYASLKGTFSLGVVRDIVKIIDSRYYHKYYVIRAEGLTLQNAVNSNIFRHKLFENLNPLVLEQSKLIDCETVRANLSLVLATLCAQHHLLKSANTFVKDNSLMENITHKDIKAYFFMDTLLLSYIVHDLDSFSKVVQRFMNHEPYLRVVPKAQEKSLKGEHKIEVKELFYSLVINNWPSRALEIVEEPTIGIVITGCPQRGFGAKIRIVRPTLTTDGEIHLFPGNTKDVPVTQKIDKLGVIVPKLSHFLETLYTQAAQILGHTGNEHPFVTNLRAKNEKFNAMLMQTPSASPDVSEGHSHGKTVID